jgi:hypothetical protein
LLFGAACVNVVPHHIQKILANPEGLVEDVNIDTEAKLARVD